MKNIIIAVIIMALTAVGTFVATMNNLHITVNEEGNGALVECFGQQWYHDTEDLHHLVSIEEI